MNTRKRLAAMRTAGALAPAAEALANPACILGPGQRCEHALVDPELNCRLYAYEQRVRGRFAAIADTLKLLSAEQHELDFVPRAQALARERLGYELPAALLEDSWVAGLDLRALHAWCIFPAAITPSTSAHAPTVACRGCCRSCSGWPPARRCS